MMNTNSIGPKTKNMIEFLKYVTELVGFNKGTGNYNCNNESFKDCADPKDKQACSKIKRKKQYKYLKMCSSFVPGLKNCMYYPGSCMNEIWQSGGTCGYHEMNQDNYTVNIGVITCIKKECYDVSLAADIAQHGLFSKTLCDKVGEIQSFTKDDFKQPDVENDEDKNLIDLQPAWLHGQLDVNIPEPEEVSEKEDSEDDVPTDPTVVLKDKPKVKPVFPPTIIKDPTVVPKDRTVVTNQDQESEKEDDEDDVVVTNEDEESEKEDDEDV